MEKYIEDFTAYTDGLVNEQAGSVNTGRDLNALRDHFRGLETFVVDYQQKVNVKYNEILNEAKDDTSVDFDSLQDKLGEIAKEGLLKYRALHFGS
ncbi:MAG: hypothetical protein EOO06_00415 [Chitinophagaceae bacterium]|nr:MAG: hypothetical protein EOO06_00415 [Chitinophagaceae bacterium]